MSSIEIPSNRVAPIAAAQASRSKMFAALWLVLAGLFLLIAVTLPFGHLPQLQGKAQPIAPLIGGIGFWVVLFGVVGAIGLRRARAATRVSQLAAETPEMVWYVAGGQLVATTAAGVPRPDLSFKVARHLRAQLLAAPPARVIER